MNYNEFLRRQSEKPVPASLLFSTMEKAGVDRDTTSLIFTELGIYPDYSAKDVEAALTMFL